MTIRFLVILVFVLALCGLPSPGKTCTTYECTFVNGRTYRVTQRCGNTSCTSYVTETAHKACAGSCILSGSSGYRICAFGEPYWTRHTTGKVCDGATGKCMVVDWTVQHESCTGHLVPFTCK